jgi:hypothetical protein
LCLKEVWISMKRPGNLLFTWRSNLLDVVEGKEGLDKQEVTWHPE